MISPAPESPEMIVFAPLSLASVGLYPEFIRKVEYLTEMDVGYRKDGALSVSIDGGGGKELGTAVALQQSVGLRAETLSAE